MKTEILCKEKNDTQIDWDKVQLVETKTGSGLVVLTNGRGLNTDSWFAGAVLAKSESSRGIGISSDNWDPKQFKKVALPLTLKFL